MRACVLVSVRSFLHACVPVCARASAPMFACLRASMRVLPCVRASVRASECTCLCVCVYVRYFVVMMNDAASGQEMSGFWTSKFQIYLNFRF